MIDLKKVEQMERPLLDTNVLIFALDGGKKNPAAAVSRALFDAFVKRKARLLIAAPSFSEFQMRTSGRDLPVGPILEVVSFDHDAARVLAERMSLDHLKTFNLAPPNTPNARHCLKYDSMIVSCASRHNASCIISTDEEHIPKIAAEAGVRCLTPRFFEQAQLPLI